MLSIPSPTCGVASGANDTSRVMIRDDDRKGGNVIIVLCYSYVD